MKCSSPSTDIKCREFVADGRLMFMMAVATYREYVSPIRPGPTARKCLGRCSICSAADHADAGPDTDSLRKELFLFVMGSAC